MHSAAREMVHVAEQGFTAVKTLDPTWQEMLNHATSKVCRSSLQHILSSRIKQLNVSDFELCFLGPLLHDQIMQQILLKTFFFLFNKSLI